MIEIYIRHGMVNMKFVIVLMFFYMRFVVVIVLPKI